MSKLWHQRTLSPVDRTAQCDEPTKVPEHLMQQMARVTKVGV